MRKSRFTALLLVAALATATIPKALATESEPVQTADGGSWAAAGLSNVIYVPAKGLSCAVSGIGWLGVMLLTGGTKYKAAGNFVHDACTGKWIIKGEDMVSKSTDSWDE